MRRYPARTRKGSKTPQESGKTNHIKPEQGEKVSSTFAHFFTLKKLTMTNLITGTIPARNAGIL